MKLLLSIKPCFAEKIFCGEKTFEYRRRIHRMIEVKTVLVYVTLPVGQVVGEFDIEAIHCLAPERLWSKTRKRSGITKEFYDSYFSGCEVAYALEIGRARLFPKPFPINAYLPSGVPPQSYAYVQRAA